MKKVPTLSRLFVCLLSYTKVLEIVVTIVQRNGVDFEDLLIYVMDKNINFDAI